MSKEIKPIKLASISEKQNNKLHKLDFCKLENTNSHLATLEIYERKEPNLTIISQDDTLLFRRGGIGCAELLKTKYYGESTKNRRYFLYYVSLDKLINPYKDEIDNLGYANFWLDFINSIGFEVELVDINENYKYYNSTSGSAIATSETKPTKCLVYKIEYNNPKNIFFANWQATRYINSQYSYIIVQECYRLYKAFGNDLDNFTIFQLAHLYLTKDSNYRNSTWQIYPSYSVDYSIIHSIYSSNGTTFLVNEYSEFINKYCIDGSNNRFTISHIFPFYKTFDDFKNTLSKSNSINGVYMYKNYTNWQPSVIIDRFQNLITKSSQPINLILSGCDNFILEEGYTREEVTTNLINAIDMEGEYDIIEDILNVLFQKDKELHFKISKEELTVNKTK
jgi:hypothetical protein